MNKEDTKVADIFTEDINNLTEHLNIVIAAHNKQLDLIDQLTNNWNELEEYLKGLINNFKEDVSTPILHEQLAIEMIYQYMQEIKEGKNDKDQV